MTPGMFRAIWPKVAEFFENAAAKVLDGASVRERVKEAFLAIAQMRRDSPVRIGPGQRTNPGRQFGLRVVGEYTAPHAYLTLTGAKPMMGTPGQRMMGVRGVTIRVCTVAPRRRRKDQRPDWYRGAKRSQPRHGLVTAGA